jgi:hypothetical protein
VERDDVAGLRQAIEREFRDDPTRLAIARHHVEQAAKRGQPAVAAVAALDRMVEFARASRYVPVNGPPTINDEVEAVADAIICSALAKRLDALEADVAEFGAPAALAALRVELEARHGAGRRLIRGAGRRCSGLAVENPSWAPSGPRRARSCPALSTFDVGPKEQAKGLASAPGRIRTATHG